MRCNDSGPAACHSDSSASQVTATDNRRVAAEPKENQSVGGGWWYECSGGMVDDNKCSRVGRVAAEVICSMNAAAELSQGAYNAVEMKRNDVSIMTRSRGVQKYFRFYFCRPCKKITAKNAQQQQKCKKAKKAYTCSYFMPQAGQWCCCTSKERHCIPRHFVNGNFVCGHNGVTNEDAISDTTLERSWSVVKMKIDGNA